MFKVYCDGTTIYDPRVEDLALLEPKVTLELNKAGSFTFKLPPEHPYYDLPQKVKSKISVYWDDAEIFVGRPVTESIDFWNRKSIECEGELAYLNDTIQRPGEYHDYTVRQYLEMLIGNHNGQVDEDKQFTVGIVTVTADDSDDDDEGSLYRYTNYNSTMEEAKADLVDDLGGYLKVRNENGYRYLDYLELEDYGDTSSQVIEFGENLLDFARNVDMSDIATAVIPLGETLEESEIEALDAHLTIEDVNDGVDYVQDDDAVEKYGFIAKVVEWSDITTPEYLYSKATKYLKNYVYENLVIEASAVDMHLADDDVMRLKLGDKVRVLSEPHDLDEYFYISAMSIRLDSPSSTTVTLGVDESESLTAQTASISSEVQNNKVSKSTILASAVAQATALITASTHGYVMLNDTDDDGAPDELVIMDTDDTDTATNVWRWNLNGLGYSSTGYNGEYGTAITMDGQIVGTYIAAGTVGTEQLDVEYVAWLEEELENRYTIAEIKQELTAGGGVLDSIIAETYATIDTTDTLSTQITQTAESITAEIEDTQNNARTYFAADASSVTISTGTIAFTSDTISIESDYFTLTAEGKITATSVTLSGAFSTDDGSHWIEIDNGAVTGGASGNTEIEGYFSVDDDTSAGSDMAVIAGRNGLVLRTPALYVGDYSEPGSGGSTSSGASASTAISLTGYQYLLSCQTTSGVPSVKYQTVLTALSESTMTVVTSLSGTSRYYYTASSSSTTYCYLPTSISYSSTIGGYYISSYSAMSLPSSASLNSYTLYSSYGTSSSALSSSTSATSTTLYYLYGGTSNSYGYHNFGFTKGILTSYT